MSWTKGSDSAATYPALMQTAGVAGADERTLNEVAGWVFRCAFQSAAHLTDYRIDMGTAWMLGGPRTPQLMQAAVTTGLLTEVEADGIRYLKLIEDPDFIHIRLKADVEWDRQQRNDTRDPQLRVPMLRRDGDNCRWCGVRVMWRGRTSNRTGTMDHLFPGQPGTATTVVVACKSCNSSRQDNPQWDDDHDLRPEPRHPQYGPVTAAYLTEHGYPTHANVGTDAAPAAGVRPAGLTTDPAPGHGVRPVEAPADPAPARVRPEPQTPPGGRPPQEPSVTTVPKSARKSTGGSDEMSSAGSGREGSGSGREPQTGSGAAGARPRRRRGRRRGGGGQGSTQESTTSRQQQDQREERDR